MNLLLLNGKSFTILIGRTLLKVSVNDHSKELSGTPFATYAYSVKGEMQTETLNPNGPPPIQTRTFSYTAKGLLTSISNSLFTETLKDSIGVNGTEKFYHGLYASVQTAYGTMTPTPPQYTYKFRYDKYGRLDKADNNNYNNWDIGVTNATTYDLNGNITQLQRASMGSKSYTYKSNTNTPQTIGSWRMCLPILYLLPHPSQQ
jgi:hypothetical protein